MPISSMVSEAKESLRDSEELLNAALRRSVLIEQESDPLVQQEELNRQLLSILENMHTSARVSRRWSFIGLALAGITVSAVIFLMLRVLDSASSVANVVIAVASAAIFSWLREIYYRQTRSAFEIEVINKYLKTRVELLASASSPESTSKEDSGSRP